MRWYRQDIYMPSGDIELPESRDSYASKVQYKLWFFNIHGVLGGQISRYMWGVRI